MTDAVELDLIASAQGGDVDAIGALYDRHHESIFKYLWLRLGNQHVAEDLTGDVFLRMLDALPAYRTLGLPFRAWLYRIAHNLLVDHYRRESKHVPISLDTITLHADNGDPVSDIEHRLLIDHVGRALTDLDPNQREVITLRFIIGLSLRETALSVGKTEAAVKSMQHRGLSALRAALKPEREQVIE